VRGSESYRRIYSHDQKNMAAIYNIIDIGPFFGPEGVATGILADA
jgi:hypothetical protein